jgi:hypothetical protein
VSTGGLRGSLPLLDPAPDWFRPGHQQDYCNAIILWHGCTSWDLNRITSNPSVLLDPRAGRADLDFGQGFYTTSRLRQARHWGWKRYFDSPLGPPGPPDIPLQPVVLKFRVPLSRIAPLESLHFVLGDYDDERFWSLVQYCRHSPPGVVRHHHHPTNADGWYDMVTGPVSDFWPQRSTMRQGDQASFHTQRAVDVLNDLIRSGSQEDFDWQPVV